MANARAAVYQVRPLRRPQPEGEPQHGVRPRHLFPARGVSPRGFPLRQGRGAQLCPLRGTFHRVGPAAHGPCVFLPGANVVGHVCRLSLGTVCWDNQHVRRLCLHLVASQSPEPCCELRWRCAVTQRHARAGGGRGVGGRAVHRDLSAHYSLHERRLGNHLLHCGAKQGNDDGVCRRFPRRRGCRGHAPNEWGQGAGWHVLFCRVGQREEICPGHEALPLGQWAPPGLFHRVHLVDHRSDPADALLLPGNVWQGQRGEH
mmetsp:Transcript_9334/g.21820  ORF Transcript_9334/g.21820 Transcript_9334/m.21820 type:complete len:259 (-) Transcript_9334:816-1592(-)